MGENWNSKSCLTFEEIIDFQSTLKGWTYLPDNVNIDVQDLAESCLLKLPPTSIQVSSSTFKLLISGFKFKV